MLCKRHRRNLSNGNITIEELKSKILQGATLIDVRSNQEYKEGHLEGAINIPDFEISDKILKEIPQKNRLIVLYCQYGGRSQKARLIMEKMGYNNVYNLDGGLDSL